MPPSGEVPLRSDYFKASGLHALFPKWWVAVGTEVQTAAHPQAGLHSSWKSFNLINPDSDNQGAANPICQNQNLQDL